jgi:predicted regulator of Ras-like GTPase activity (Roadblock/LC7/MglB family)
MFEFFKNLFGKPADDADSLYPAKSTASTVSTRPGATFRPRHTTQPASSPANTNATAVNISLQAVLDSLPVEFRGRVQPMDLGGATLTISMERVMSQLASGAVKLPFGELRRAAPQLFSPENDLDQVPVALPLGEILPRIDPSMLVRRGNQKQVDLPSNISSPFGDRGQGLILTTAKPAEVPQRGIVPPPTTPVPPRQPGPVHSKAPALPQKSPVQPALRPPVKPSPPAMAPARNHIAPPSPPSFRAPVVPAAPAVPAPPPPAVPAAPVVPAAPAVPPPPLPVSPALRHLGSALSGAPPNGSASLRPPPGPPGTPLSAPAIPLAATPAKPAQPQSAPLPLPPTPARPASSESVLLPTGLGALAEDWPETLKQEILSFNLVDSKLTLPVDLVEESLKRGRVAFPWKILRSWIKPPASIPASAHDGTVVELPLKLIMPLFLARHKAHKEEAKQHVAVDESIPNLFFGFPQADDSPFAGNTGSPPVPSQAVTKPVETNYYVWDDTADSAYVDETEFKRKPSPETNFVTRCATPNEVVSRAAALEGVCGALVALPDGLMVASKLSPELNGDTLAAFLPQIFGKVSQCTKELRMGELNNLNFTVGNVPWKIFRVNAIFFAAFGRAGQGLPTAQLSALAAELDHRKQ